MLMDKIAMITILIIYIIFALISLFTYLIIVGGNMNKTDEERRLEDEEQMNYLKEYKNRRNNSWSKK